MGIFDEYAGQWVHWASIKGGNDGRRASATVWQRTKLKHFARTTIHTLCNREIGSLVIIAGTGLYDPPECKICRRRLNGN